jgi:glycolate oxidase FAD binding subunit
MTSIAPATVGGVAVPTVLMPTSLDELSLALASTDAANQAVCIAGSGSKLEIGAAPAKLDVLVWLAGMAELIEYNPHDLVIRAQAGMPVATLQALVAESGQRLALDPPEESATLGGLVAANASGPLRHRYGTVRDLLIGATFVLADGTVAHTGGKVVKNVAGYDLAKLLTGSYGTIAALADVTFRLHGRPGARVAVRTPVSSIDDVERVLAGYNASQVEPSALELQLELPPGTGAVLALFEGHEATTRAHADAAANLAGGESTIVEWDEQFAHHPWGPTDLGLRLAYPPGALGPVLRAAAKALGSARVVARAGIGVLELATPAATGSEQATADLVATLRTATARLGASVVVVAATPEVKTQLDVWGPAAGLDLMRAIKDQFDPGHRLAPGRFVGGI